MRLFIMNEWESERLINSAARYLNVDEIYVQFADYKTTNNNSKNSSKSSRAAYYLAYGFENMHQPFGKWLSVVKWEINNFSHFKIAERNEKRYEKHKRSLLMMSLLQSLLFLFFSHFFSPVGIHPFPHIYREQDRKDCNICYNIRLPSHDHLVYSTNENIN